MSTIATQDFVYRYEMGSRQHSGSCGEDAGTIKRKYIMTKYFGTDGFRGEAGITLTADHAYKVGRFLGWYYNVLRERNGDTDPARIAIGKDNRRSSYMFEYSLVAGLTASSADAYLLHVMTTPSVAYMVDEDELKDGLHFEIQYIDSMRNEYIQEYDMKKEYSSIKIECGYPGFLEQF